MKVKYHKIPISFQISVKRSHKNTGRSYRREKNKLKINQICAHCGESDPELLEFDHIDQDDKSINISHCYSAKKIKEEMHKIQFLCIWCHRLKTKEQTAKKYKIKD